MPSRCTPGVDFAYEVLSATLCLENVVSVTVSEMLRERVASSKLKHTCAEYCNLYCFFYCF